MALKSAQLFQGQAGANSKGSHWEPVWFHKHLRVGQYLEVSCSQGLTHILNIAPSTVETLVMPVPAKGKDGTCPGAGADPANPRARQLYWSLQEENGLWNGHCFTQQCSSQAGLSQGNKQDTLYSPKWERVFGRVGMRERKTKALAPAPSWWPTEALPCRHSFLLIFPTSLLCTISLQMLRRTCSGRPARVWTMTTTTQRLLTPALDWLKAFSFSPDNSRQPQDDSYLSKTKFSLHQYGKGCPDPPNTLLFLVWYAQTCTHTCQI